MKFLKRKKSFEIEELWQKNVLNAVFTDFEHDIAVQLKQKNFLYRVISDIIEGRFNTRHLMRNLKC